MSGQLSCKSPIASKFRSPKKISAVVSNISRRLHLHSHSNNDEHSNNHNGNKNKNLSKRFASAADEEKVVISSHAITQNIGHYKIANNNDNSFVGNNSLMNASIISDDGQSRELLFSPKYADTCSENVDEDDGFFANGLKSPPMSPKKGKQIMDMECTRCVRHLRTCVWNSAYEEIDGFLFMKYAPQLPKNYFNTRKPVLPPKSPSASEYTLVLDLDETLVHCSIETDTVCDQIFPVIFNGEQYKVFMNKRPYFQDFLEVVSELFEVVIFTASQQCYADTLLNIVDPENKLIHHRLFRNHCINIEGNFVKDLRVLGRDLSKTIIIDNSPPAFTNQIENGIPIVSWYEDRSDKELKIVLPLLKKLLTLNDVRPALRKYFQLKKLLKNLRI